MIPPRAPQCRRRRRRQRRSHHRAGGGQWQRCGSGVHDRCGRCHVAERNQRAFALHYSVAALAGRRDRRDGELERDHGWLRHRRRHAGRAHVQEVRRSTRGTSRASDLQPTLGPTTSTALSGAANSHYLGLSIIPSLVHFGLIDAVPTACSNAVPPHTPC